MSLRRLAARRVHRKPDQATQEASPFSGTFWSRRRFLTVSGGLAGALFAGGRLGAHQSERASLDVLAPGALPRPIPGGTALLGPGTERFHVVLPARPSQRAWTPGPDLELATITDFAGDVGFALLNGEALAQGRFGQQRLRYAADLRFMHGRYRGTDGRLRTGSFVMLTLAASDERTHKDEHHYSPGLGPNGLYCTTLVPASALSIDHATGRARLELRDLPLGDSQSLAQMLARGRAKPVQLSLTAAWHDPRLRFSVTDPAHAVTSELATLATELDFSVTAHDHRLQSQRCQGGLGLLGIEQNGQHQATARG